MGKRPQLKVCLSNILSENISFEVLLQAKQDVEGKDDENLSKIGSKSIRNKVDSFSDEQEYDSSDSSSEDSSQSRNVSKQGLTCRFGP